MWRVFYWPYTLPALVLLVPHVPGAGDREGFETVVPVPPAVGRIIRHLQTESAIRVPMLELSRIGLGWIDCVVASWTDLNAERLVRVSELSQSEKRLNSNAYHRDLTANATE